MSQQETPLYPKLSSIYNKIMQLAIAIILIILLLNMSLFSQQETEQVIGENFDYVGQQFLDNAASGIEVLLTRGHKKSLQAFVDKISEQSMVKEVLVYNVTGQLQVSSTDGKSINDLYGISINRLNQSDIYIPFAKEIRTDKVIGYIRIVIEKEFLVKSLNTASYEQQQLSRLMLLIAGVVGFLLTRGFNRFSRQGYRLTSDK